LAEGVDGVETPAFPDPVGVCADVLAFSVELTVMFQLTRIKEAFNYLQF
jgi:hypothetical protein